VANVRAVAGHGSRARRTVTGAWCERAGWAGAGSREPVARLSASSGGSRNYRTTTHSAGSGADLRHPLPRLSPPLSSL